MTLQLVSHRLCPYVQRAVIALTEKGVPFQRTDIDLRNKPDWFLAVSPLGKTPVLVANEVPIFESAVILEYLEETQPNPLHPAHPLARAQHRAWMEYGSSVLNDIAGFYNAPNEARLSEKSTTLGAKFERLEAQLGEHRYFESDAFSLVDAVFGPVFRYFDVFEQVDIFIDFSALPKVARWRGALADRPSVQAAVAEDYPERLAQFLVDRGSYLSHLMSQSPIVAGVEE